MYEAVIAKIHSTYTKCTGNITSKVMEEQSKHFICVHMLSVHYTYCINSLLCYQIWMYYHAIIMFSNQVFPEASTVATWACNHLKAHSMHSHLELVSMIKGREHNCTWAHGQTIEALQSPSIAIGCHFCACSKTKRI